MNLHIPLANHGRSRSLPRRSRSLRLVSSIIAAATLAVALTAVFALPVSAATGDFMIQGRGYGHGAGMSQWGAWEAAREGQTYNTILAFYYPGSAPAAAPVGATIKVRISKDPTSTTYDDHYYRVYMKPVGTTATLVLQNDGSPDVTVALAIGQVVETLYAPVAGVGHVWVAGRGAYDHVYVTPDAGTGRVAVSMQVSSVAVATTYREYWGSMNAEPMGEGELYLNNHVLLDKYVRGVAELKPEWANAASPNLYAIEAVKAQAVAARTYAWAEFNSVGYVNDDTRDIYYSGYKFEVDYPGAAQAATDTAGEILKYGGVLYKTYFCSHSGGYTTASAWNDSPPFYVVSQPDPWSRAAPPAGLPGGIAPGYTWTTRVTPADLGTKLIGSGYIDNVGTINLVEVIARDTTDPESHVTALRITGTLGSDTISGRDFKAALGLRSTLFNVLVDGGLTRTDAANANIAYLGYWTPSYTSAAFGGSFVYSDSAAKTSVSFDGTYLALVAKTAPYYGKATVTLDGGTPVPVDFYSPTSLYQQTVYSTGNLVLGAHTVTIQWTGTKNFLSTGTYIGIDAVDIMGGTLTPSPDLPPRHEQDNTNFSFGGPWSTISSAAASGGTLKVLNSPGSVTATFTGTYLAWVARTGPSFGKASVTLDGGTPTMVDLYSAAEVNKQSVYNTGFLGAGPHTVTIEWTGTKNGAASSYQIGVDAFDIIGTVTAAPPAPAYPTRYQQSESFITYLGSWATTSNTSASGASFISSSLVGTQATISFHGTGLTLLAKTGPEYGIAQVSLDGAPPVLVDFYSATALYLQSLYTTGPLADADHTLVIQPDGTKNGASTGYAVDIDAVDIFGDLTAAPAPTRYQQTESNLTYVGYWGTSYPAAASGGSLIYLNSAGSVTVNFTGTYLGWVAKKSNQYGSAWVRLDNGLPQLVDLYSASTQYKQTVWNTGVLASGVHTVSISWAGFRNPLSAASNIGVDAFDIMGTLNAAPAPPAMPTRYQNTNTKLIYAGSWVTGYSTWVSGGNFRYLNAAGSVTIKFDGTYMSWVTRKSPVYGIASVTLDGGAPVSIDLYRSAQANQLNVYDTGLLAPGPHTVVITWTGTKNVSATATNIGIDALDIIGSLTL